MQDSTKIRAVLVGAGGMSTHWLEAIRLIPEIEMVGLVDVIEEAARNKAVQFGLHDVAIGSDLQQILQQVTPDAVFNCTIPEAHLEVTLTALANGCHVLCEKPMADTMEHARTMLSAAEASGKVVAIIQNRRYDSNIRRLKAFLDSGVLGQITTVNCDFYLGPHFGGFRDRMRHVLLLDMAIHTFDTARFLTGHDAQAVYCKEWNPAGSWFDHDASAMAIFEMEQGVIYSYRGSWCADGLPTSWESEWRIVGQNGTVKWDGASTFQAQVVAESGQFTSTYRDVPVPEHDPGLKTGGHLGLLREFVSCIKTGSVPETNCADNIKSLAMVFGAIKSAETGQRVAVKW